MIEVLLALGIIGTSVLAIIACVAGFMEICASDTDLGGKSTNFFDWYVKTLKHLKKFKRGDYSEAAIGEAGVFTFSLLKVFFIIWAMLPLVVLGLLIWGLTSVSGWIVALCIAGFVGLLVSLVAVANVMTIVYSKINSFFTLCNKIATKGEDS